MSQINLLIMRVAHENSHHIKLGKDWKWDREVAPSHNSLLPNLSFFAMHISVL